MLKSAFGLSVLIFMAVPAFGQNNLSCSIYPGNKLCDLMVSTQTAYDWTCRGAACNSVWRNQLHMDHNLIVRLNETPYDKTWTVEQDLGYKAWSLADAICRSTRTFGPGDYDLLIGLANEENTLLPWLADLQRMAHLGSVRTCVITTK
jgi:hypothetical protein